MQLQNINFEEIDITLETNESDKKFMRENARPAGNQKVPIPPQIFKGDEYCGVSFMMNFYLKLSGSKSEN